MGKLTRREFLKGTAAGIGIYGTTSIPLTAFAEEAPNKSRVVIVTSPNVIVDKNSNINTPSKLGMELVGEADPSIDQKVLNSMVAEGIKAFTGEKTETAAWKKLFKPNDVVGIKVNCLFSIGASTHPEIIASLIAGLRSIGIPANNIIVWDRNNREMKSAGFVINSGGSGVQCYGTEDDYDAEPTQMGSFRGRLSKILTQKITALINVPILKDHSISGITCAMKNHYGSHKNPGDHHANGCDPYLADLNSIPAIREKTRLIVCDAIKPQCHGGPGYKPDFVWEYKSLLFGADPVALDYIGWQIIEKRRAEIGKKPLAQEGRPTKFIDTASLKGLGTNDPARIETIKKQIIV
ncbi:MAG: DUF362 domain-containing protein [Armatimonadota bacterium]|nr:DUF362 domain-containing protein [Armatimonadota bacterium]